MRGRVEAGAVPVTLDEREGVLRERHLGVLVVRAALDERARRVHVAGPDLIDEGDERLLQVLEHPLDGVDANVRLVLLEHDRERLRVGVDLVCLLALELEELLEVGGERLEVVVRLGRLPSVVGLGDDGVDLLGQVPVDGGCAFVLAADLGDDRLLVVVEVGVRDGLEPRLHVLAGERLVLERGDEAALGRAGGRPARGHHHLLIPEQEVVDGLEGADPLGSVQEFPVRVCRGVLGHWLSLPHDCQNCIPIPHAGRYRRGRSLRPDRG